MTSFSCPLDVDHDPRKIVRDERKARVAKNERQRLQNLAHTTGSSADRKKEIDRTLATTRISTASMGKFDRQLEGEKKPRGVKRKVPMFDIVTSCVKFTFCFSLTRQKRLPSRRRRTLSHFFLAWRVTAKRCAAHILPATMALLTFAKPFDQLARDKKGFPSLENLTRRKSQDSEIWGWPCLLSHASIVT
jgi:hypothetical protein